MENVSPSRWPSVERIVRAAPGARTFFYLLAGAGIFAAFVHAGFISVGFPQFRNMVSLGLLIAIFLVSIAQIVMLR